MKTLFLSRINWDYIHSFTFYWPSVSSNEHNVYTILIHKNKRFKIQITTLFLTYFDDLYSYHVTFFITRNPILHSNCSFELSKLLYNHVNHFGNKVSRGQLKHKPMTVQGSAVRVVGSVLVFRNYPLGLLETTWPQQ